MRTPVSRCRVAMSSDGPPIPSELLTGPRPWPGMRTTTFAGIFTIAPAFLPALICTSEISALGSCGAVDDPRTPLPPRWAGSVSDPVSRIVMLCRVAAGMTGLVTAVSLVKTFGMRWMLPSRWRTARNPPSATTPTTATSEATAISAIRRARPFRLAVRIAAEAVAVLRVPPGRGHAQHAAEDRDADGAERVHGLPQLGDAGLAITDHQ